MLVDDNPADNFLHRLVISKSGVAEEVNEFESPVEALQALQEKTSLPCSLLLLDINMPQMNGFQFLERYGELDQEQRRNRVVVMLTTSLNREDEARARSTPYVSDYANKPLTIAKIKELAAKYSDCC
jgi:CheY-like chemotaxis protein